MTSKTYSLRDTDIEDLALVIHELAQSNWSVEEILPEMKSFLVAKEKGALLVAKPKTQYKEINYTAFGKTKRVVAQLHHMEMDEEPEEVLWVERAEDWYALMSHQLRSKRVAVVRREDWLRAEDVNSG